MNIQDETPERILFLIRLCHPQTKGEKYDRWDVIKEIKRRGFKLLIDLGWGADLDHIYKNRYTASEEKLKEILIKDRGIQGVENCDDLFSVLEHYAPIELWTDVDCHDEYNPKGLITGWLK